MKRIYFLIVAITTFALGCALAWLEPRSPKLYIIESTVEIHGGNKGPLEGIEPTGRGCGNGYAQSYVLPNGSTLGESNECFSSYKEANKEMRSWLKKADHIFERVAPAKQTNRLKSERVVASFPPDEYGRWVRIMWVDGQCIHSIQAPAMYYALEFERSEYNPYKFDE